MRFRCEWAEGPWDDEPDCVNNVAHGYPYTIRRHFQMGILCAYVGVPEGHPWHGEDFRTVKARVHGRLTYSDHVPAMSFVYQGAPDGFWWLGFDCGHGFDGSPLDLGTLFREEFAALRRAGEGTYRDLAFVTAECESLAKQAREEQDRYRMKVK
jgi:hypothetical protein